MALKFLLVILSVIYFVSCENQNMNNTEDHLSTENSRKSREIGSYLGLMSCAMKYDASCFVDAAENYLELKRTELLAQADAEVARTTGRSDPSTRPSHLANVIGKLITELSKMFQTGVSGYFASAREADDEDLLNDSDNSDLTSSDSSDSNGEARGKKKKKKEKLMNFLKLFALGAVVYKKICLILKIFHAALHFKFFLLALAGLLLHAIKVWHGLKKDHNPSKVIYYEHAQHQHHYGHGEEDSHGLWARAFHDGNNSNAPLLAYNGQRPYLVVAVADNAL